MARGGDSPNGARRAAGLTLGALTGLARKRGGVDHPGLYPEGDNPWTDQLARSLRDLLAEELSRAPDPNHHHVIAARWRALALLPDVGVEAGRDPLYSIAWRAYSADRARMTAQPLIVECPWRGGWPSLAAACDRLAQGRAGLKLLCAMADPGGAVGEMTLAQACALRIAACSPPGEAVRLAFYGRADGWRNEAGFSLFDYTTGERRLTAVP